MIFIMLTYHPDLLSNTSPNFLHYNDTRNQEIHLLQFLKTLSKRQVSVLVQPLILLLIVCFTLLINVTNYHVDQIILLLLNLCNSCILMYGVRLLNQLICSTTRSFLLTFTQNAYDFTPLNRYLMLQQFSQNSKHQWKNSLKLNSFPYSLTMRCRPRLKLIP